MDALDSDWTGWTHLGRGAPNRAGSCRGPVHWPSIRCPIPVESAGRREFVEEEPVVAGLAPDGPGELRHARPRGAWIADSRRRCGPRIRTARPRPRRHPRAPRWRGIGPQSARGAGTGGRGPWPRDRTWRRSSRTVNRPSSIRAARSPSGGRAPLRRCRRAPRISRASSALRMAGAWAWTICWRRDSRAARSSGCMGGRLRPPPCADAGAREVGGRGDLVRTVGAAGRFLRPVRHTRGRGVDSEWTGPPGVDAGSWVGCANSLAEPVTGERFCKRNGSAGDWQAFRR